MASSLGGRAATTTRDKADAKKEGRMETRGPYGILGGSGVSESYVAVVWTPAKPPGCFWFAGKRTSGLVRGPMRDDVE